MKADSLLMSKVFSSGGEIHYVLPHFQREYAWEKEEWQTLIKDIFSIYDVYDEIHPPEHFMGALVVINDGVQAGTLPVFRLVDGQQRLTTISLLLSALGRLLDKENEEDRNLYRKLRNMLINQYESGDLKYKVLPTLKYGDRDSYCAIIDETDPPEGIESKVPEAFNYLYDQLKIRFKSGSFDSERLYVILMTNLQVVYINLDHQERPYEIFESLNYKGKSLTQADLVRNYIAMKLPQERQEAAFMNLWSPIEEMLLEKRAFGRSKLGELTAFLRHYFSYKLGKLINQDHVYSRFRDHGEALSITEFEEHLSTLKRFADYYNRLLRPDNEPRAEIREQLRRLNLLESATAYPVFLHMYDWLEKEEIDHTEFLEGLKVFEIYLMRRFVARESTNYNRIFPPLVKEVNKTDLAESLRTILGSKSEPSDARLRQAAERVKAYDRSTFTRQKLVLLFDTINRRLSRDSGAYTMLDAEPTIEHIMPQTLTTGWRHSLGTNWQEDFELLHTLGNLTIVTQEWNTQLSNALYKTKKDMLESHGLLLNKSYFVDNAPEVWNGEAIKQRARWLIGIITELWPQLSELSAGREERPKQLIILDEIYPVESWRDVLRQTAEFAVQWTGDNFEEQIIPNLQSYFDREPSFNTSHQLSNGWWISVNHGSDWIKYMCATIIEAAEIPDEEYDLELW